MGTLAGRKKIPGSVFHALIKREVKRDRERGNRNDRDRKSSFEGEREARDDWLTDGTPGAITPDGPMEREATVKGKFFTSIVWLFLLLLALWSMECTKEIAAWIPSFSIALYLTSFVARDCYWIAGNGLKEEEHGYVKVIKMWMMGFIKLALVFFPFSFCFFCCDWMKRCIERGYRKIVPRVAWISESMNFIQRLIFSCFFKNNHF